MSKKYWKVVLEGTSSAGFTYTVSVPYEVDAEYEAKLRFKEENPEAPTPRTVSVEEVKE